MNVVYDIKDEQIFDAMAATLKMMSEKDKQHFISLFQGIQMGIHIANEKQDEENTA